VPAVILTQSQRGLTEIHVMLEKITWTSTSVCSFETGYCDSYDV